MKRAMLVEWRRQKGFARGPLVLGVRRCALSRATRVKRIILIVLTEATSSITMSLGWECDWCHGTSGVPFDVISLSIVCVAES